MSQARKPRSRAPRWTSDDSLSHPIVVSRGEPRRDDAQMFDAVQEQILAYFATIGRPMSEESAARIAAAIALDHIYHDGAQGVVLTRESVSAYRDLYQKEVVDE